MGIGLRSLHPKVGNQAAEQANTLAAATFRSTPGPTFHRLLGRCRQSVLAATSPPHAAWEAQSGVYSATIPWWTKSLGLSTRCVVIQPEYRFETW